MNFPNLAVMPCHGAVLARRIALTALLLLPVACQAAYTFTNSPAAVSNTYAGTLTLQIGGLTNGETVVIKKFLDVNTNGVIDAGDLLVQQFTLTDGTNFVIGGVTNFDVPGDLNSATGAITAKLRFQIGDFNQNIIGQYLFKLSSPNGRQPAVTNLFNVTNTAYAQKITGTIANAGTNVPNAVVLMFPPSRPGKNGPGGNPVAAVVANNAGNYSIQLPMGTYVPMAYRSNYVADFSASPSIALASGGTTNVTLSLTNATTTISGRLVDAVSTNTGLPGVFGSASANSLITVGFSDSNGNILLRVRPGMWNLGGDDSGLIVHGYVGYQQSTNIDATAGDVTNVTFYMYQATALFYGSVKDNLGNPLAGIDITSQDNNGNIFQQDGYTDTNGNYYVGAVAGLGDGDPWTVQPNNGSESKNPSNYLFSQSTISYNGGTNFAAGQAALQNFTGIIATNHISGNVTFNGSPVSGVQVYAYTNIGGADYQAQADTDTNGNYSFTVPNGNWNVNVNCQYGGNNLNNIITNGNYYCPDSQTAAITNNNATNNFIVPLCAGPQILTASPLPDAQEGTAYSEQLSGTTCNGNLNWWVNDPSNFPASQGLNMDSNGFISGIPSGIGVFNFSVHLNDNNGHGTDTNMSLTITAAVTLPQVDTASVPSGTNGVFYSTTLSASGGTPPYAWSLSPFSASLPGNLNLNTNGTVSGTPTNSGGSSFYARVTDAALNTADSAQLQLYFVNQPVVITNTTLPKGIIGAAYSVQLGATGGQTPFNCWQLAAGSANPPPGLVLNCNGSITGTPTNAGTFFFLAQAMDYYGSTDTKPLSITVNVKPVLSLPFWLTNQFRARLTGATGQNYTVQYSTTLTNWNPLLITNSAATNAFLIVDPAATNRQRVYRVLVGP